MQCCAARYFLRRWALIHCAPLMLINRSQLKVYIRTEPLALDWKPCMWARGYTLTLYRVCITPLLPSEINNHNAVARIAFWKSTCWGLLLKSVTQNWSKKPQKPVAFVNRSKASSSSSSEFISRALKSLLLLCSWSVMWHWERRVTWCRWLCESCRCVTGAGVVGAARGRLLRFARGTGALNTSRAQPTRKRDAPQNKKHPAKEREKERQWQKPDTSERLSVGGFIHAGRQN